MIMTHTRHQRVRQQSTRLKDFKLFLDNVVDKEVEIVHLAMFANYKPISFDDAIKLNTWVKVMKEELDAIVRNQTLKLVNSHEKQKLIDVK